MRSRFLALAALAAFAMPAAAGEPPTVPGPGGDGKPAGEARDPAAPGMDATSAEREVLACSLVVLCRAVEVRQVLREGAFGGTFRVTVRAERVVKGALGPVMALAFPLAAADLESFAPLLEGILRPDAPPAVLFLDEGDRMRAPPLFRVLGPPRPLSAAAAADAAVETETKRQAARILSLEEPEREAAGAALAALGSPVLPVLRRIQETGSPESAECARQAVLAVHNLLCDPCRVVARNAKYPSNPVAVLAAPDSRDILFRLPPGALVFRFETWSSQSGSYTRIRIADGREGWMESDACVPAAVPGD
jgi:hypothetical protein